MPRTPKKSKPASEPSTPPHGGDTESSAGDSMALSPIATESADRSKVAFPVNLPMLPIPDQVYFPHMMFPLLVGREKSVRALEEAAAQQRYIFIVAQRNLHAEDPDPDDIYTVGIAAEVLQILRVPDGTVRVMLEGIERVRTVGYIQEGPFFKVVAEPLETKERKDIEIEALMRAVTGHFEQVVNIGRNIAPEAVINVVNTNEAGRLADPITPYLQQLRA